jgi:hypothetical protein
MKKFYKKQGAVLNDKHYPFKTYINFLDELIDVLMDEIPSGINCSISYLLAIKLKLYIDCYNKVFCYDTTDIDYWLGCFFAAYCLLYLVKII